ncbi:MAG: NitT/TauT family transport system permease protein [Alphaproteobacteria bacterium]|jgi:NitT/TauT family transport system permease protein|nr:NitT/TauT family transport system permease protein [Alphaproteobacteria bacterium]
MSLTQTEMLDGRVIARHPPKYFAHGVTAVWTRRLIVLGALVLWEIWTRLAGNSELIAPPSSIVRALFSDILSDAAIRGAIMLTLFEVVSAYALAIVVGLAMGLAIGSTNLSRRSLFPVVLLLYAIPQVILLPLFTLGFGIGPAAKIAFGFSHGVFPILVNVVAGMRNVNPLYLKAARSMGARRSDIIRNVTFPHMVASFFTGLRLSMTMTLLGVILAELYVSTAGVGYFTKLFAETFDPAPLFALIGTLAIMAIGLNEIVRAVERRFTRWKDWAP